MSKISILGRILIFLFFLWIFLSYFDLIRQNTMPFPVYSKYNLITAIITMFFP